MKKWLGVAIVAMLSLLSLGMVASGQDFGPMTRDAGPREQMGGPMMHRDGPGMFRAGGRFGRGHDMGQRMLAMLDNERVRTYLNLTDPQAQQLREILVNAEKSSVETRAQLTVRGIELRELLRADNPDAAAVMKKVQEISDLRAEMMKQHIQAFLNAQKVLTPEQRKKIRQFRENRRAFGMRREGVRTHRGFGERRPQGQGMPPAPSPRPGEPPVN